MSPSYNVVSGFRENKEGKTFLYLTLSRIYRHVLRILYVRPDDFQTFHGNTAIFY